MAIAPMSYAFLPHGHTRGAAAAAPVARPVPTDAAAAPEVCAHDRQEGPRRTPLMRVLMAALDSMVATPPPSTTATTSTDSAAGPVPAAAPPAPAADAAPTPDLDTAMMNFAHALMQVLRGSGDSDAGGQEHDHGHGHHGHHGHHGLRHDFGRRAWGDPAGRIAQVAAQAGSAASPPAAANPTTAQPAAPESSAPAAAATDTQLEPAVATSLASAANAPASTVAAQPAGDKVASPWTRAFARLQQNMLDAFATLQRARGVDTADDADSLPAQLTAFLQALAEQVRLSASDTTAAARPGALIDLTA